MNPIFTFLAGTWFIVSSNFPMWLDGKKTNPTLNYSIAQKGVDTVLIDEVQFLSKDKTKSIIGYDYIDSTNSKAFVWKGKGLLALAKSNWEIKMVDEENECAVIWFSKTTFTPEGADIICRKSTMDSLVLADIKEKMLEDSVLKKHVDRLKDLQVGR